MIALAACAARGPASTAPPAPAGAERDRVLALLRETPLVDGHNDVPWEIRERALGDVSRFDFRDTRGLEPPMHTDLERLRAGGVGAQFWSVYVPATFAGEAAVKAVLEQIDVVHRLAARYPETLEMAYGADDVERIHRAGRVASLIGVEGGHAIADSLAVLRQLYRLGARYMTLTHSQNVGWADSATDEPRHGGLDDFGRQVVAEMNRLGMLVDLSHVSPETMHDALDVAQAPVVFSHSSARALVDHPRNVPDDVLRRLPRNGGVVMITFVPSFVSAAMSRAAAAERERLTATIPDVAARDEAFAAWSRSAAAPGATLQQVADHVDHVRRVAGIDHLGIGSDFDGIAAGPRGLEDVSRFPDLFVELARRGYGDDDLRKIAGGNLLRVLRAVEARASR